MKQTINRPGHMHIIHITSELTPIAKVGGLADVIHGLSKELLKLGHSVEILLPKYDCLHLDELTELKPLKTFLVEESGKSHSNTLWSAQLHGLNLLLLETTQNYFNRKMIYGCPDDIDRFLYFCKAALAALSETQKQPDILHLHDWPTAIIPFLLKELPSPLTAATLLTIHNMEHQGLCQAHNLTRIGLHHTPDTIQDPKYLDHINLLKAGIIYADFITTVSPSYEKEIQTPPGGHGLENTLSTYTHKLKGILNGIDEEFWNPEKDPYLPQKYPTHQLTTLSLTHSGKNHNKQQLRQKYGLKEENRPLVAVITRIVPQKNPPLIKHALIRTLEKGGQFILLGTVPDPSLHAEFEALQEEYKNHPHAKILLDKNEALAHLIYAAADLFVIPSIFEPCGLTQLIALRYGAIPVARLTGGLIDTVFDIDTSKRPLADRNGFTFEFSDKEGLNWALDRALDYYIDHPQKWEELMLNAMRADFSWKHAAPEYIELYKSLSV